MQHKLGIGTIAWCCATIANGVDKGGERRKVALVGYVDARLGEGGAFVLSTLYGFGKVEVDASLVRIHAVIVVYGQAVALLHVYLHDVVHARNGNAELYAVSVHIVVCWYVEIVVRLVVMTSRKQAAALLVSLVEGVVSLSHGVLDVLLCPRSGVGEVPCSVLRLDTLADAPVVAAYSERLVGIDHEVVLGYAYHLARQHTVAHVDVSAYRRTLHILDGEVDGVGIFARNIVHRRIALVDGDVGDIAHLLVLLVVDVVHKEAVNLDKLLCLWLIVGVVGVKLARCHLNITVGCLLVQLARTGIDRLVVGFAYILFVGRSLEHERSQALL